MNNTAAWFKATALSVIAFFAPVQHLLLCTTILVSVDLITGLAAALKMKRRITSERFSGTIIKSAVYLTAICAGHLVERAFIPEIPVVRILTSTIGLRELLSVFENLNVVSDGGLSEVLAKIKQTPPK